MQPQDTIVVTGAAGFIGSYLTGFLNRKGFNNLALVDDFTIESKKKNWEGKAYSQLVQREEFINWAQDNAIDYIFHLGARTDTTEMDYAVHKKWNLDYSKDVWGLCVSKSIPLLYASSAATYGNGEWGYNDSHDIVEKLQPLNPYGQSKQDFDVWALEQKETPPFWAGVKFFNVYGPNEYHKARMASVIIHAFHQIKDKGRVKLFRSHNPDYADGGQMRDFVYVRDVAQMITWLMENQPQSGLYNIGSGKARTFTDLVTAIFTTLDKPVQIDFIDTPVDIRDKYQYFTEAAMQKLTDAGYSQALTGLEEGVQDYVTSYLQDAVYF
jgi:ADP-L-glycero-D-manno-heptose 6-epimerase